MARRARTKSEPGIGCSSCRRLSFESRSFPGHKAREENCLMGSPNRGGCSPIED